MLQHLRILLAELCQLWFYNYYTVQDSLVYLEENGFLIVRKHSKDRTICCYFSWSISLIGFFTRTISSWDMVNQYPYWVKLSISDPLTWITSNFHSFKLPKTHSPASKLSDVIYGCQSDKSFLLCYFAAMFFSETIDLEMFVSSLQERTHAAPSKNWKYSNAANLSFVFWIV